MNKITQYNQQTVPKQCKSDVDEICIYQNQESGHQHLYLKLNVYYGFHARQNPKQQYLKVVTSRSVMLDSAKSAHMFLTKQPRYYTEETIQCMRESFNIIRQKQLGLFVLGVTHLSNLPRVCVKLTQVGGWV